MKRATTQCLRKKEIEEWNGMDGGEQDLEGACLQQKLERSCWKTNNERNKLIVGLWKASQNYEVTTYHSWEKDLIES